MTPFHPSRQPVSAQSRIAAIPDGARLYVVGDIHGRLDLLERTLALIEADVDRRPCGFVLRIFLGDYVDRGPDSAGVLARLVALQQQLPAVCLSGNHEMYLLQATREPEVLGRWLEVGGRQTLQSYGLTVPQRPGRKDLAQLTENFAAILPAQHRVFLETAPSTFAFGDYLFVHAGLRPGVPLCEQQPRDLLEIRQPFLGWQENWGKLVVHGHSPVIEPELLPNRINIDTGAYTTSRLTCLCIDKDALLFL